VASLGLCTRGGFIITRGDGPTDRPTAGQTCGLHHLRCLSRVSPTVLPAHASGAPAVMSERLAQKMSRRLYLTERGPWPPACTESGCLRTCLPRGVPNEETPIDARGIVGRCCYPQPRAFDNPHSAASGLPEAAFVRGVSDIHPAAGQPVDQLAGAGADGRRLRSAPRQRHHTAPRAPARPTARGEVPLGPCSSVRQPASHDDAATAWRRPSRTTGRGVEHPSTARTGLSRSCICGSDRRHPDESRPEPPSRPFTRDTDQQTDSLPGGTSNTSLLHSGHELVT
jgi:hypothetical protein